jgi:hypothetical protein
MTSSDFQALTPDQRGALADYRALLEAHATAHGSMRGSLLAKAKRRYAKLTGELGLVEAQVSSYLSGAQTETVSAVTSGKTGLTVRINSNPPSHKESTMSESTPAPEAILIDQVNPAALSILTDDELSDEQKLAALDQAEVTAEQVELADMFIAQQAALTAPTEQSAPVATRPEPEFARVGEFVDFLVAQHKAADLDASSVSEDSIALYGLEKVNGRLVKGYGPDTKRSFPNPTFVSDVKRGLRKLASA